MSSRIALTDTPMSMVLKMVEGNPGATRVCLELIQKSESIDPDSYMGGIQQIISLDIRKIYGSRIWMLYKDVCKENIVTTIGVLRAVQLGYLSDQKLNHAIDNYGDGIDLNDLMKKVQERLPNFNKGGGDKDA